MTVINILFLLLIFNCYWWELSYGVDFSTKKVSVRRMEACKGFDKQVIKWYDLKLLYNQTAKEYNMFLKCRISREISRNFSMSFSFMKCDTSGNPDSCEYMIKDYRNDDICKYLEMKGQAWSVFIDHFDKPLRCPLKPGIYKNENLPVRGDFLKYLPIPDALWKIKFFGYERGKPISCVDGEIYIISNSRSG